MDDYLIVFANDGALSKRFYMTNLLAFNILDRTVQEVEIQIGCFGDQRGYSFLVYDGNRIIKYGGDDSFSLTCITIQSFERILRIKECIFK